MAPLQGGAAPTNVLEGLRSGIWADRNGQQIDTLYAKFIDKKKMISEVPNDVERHYKEFLKSFVEGFSSDEGVKDIMDHLLKVNDTYDNQNYHRCMVKAPADTSKNQPIVSGVVHCLMYGFHPQQYGPNRGRGRVRHRVLLPKEHGKRQRSRSRSPSRSRSRSPSPANDIETNVESIRNPGLRNRNPTIPQLLNNPDEYILEYKSLRHYFEPHKPNYLVYQGNRHNAEVKLVIEVSSYKKHKCGVPLYTCVAEDTEQCVQQCIAGLSYNQQKIQGLLIIPDGLKLICVKSLITPGLPDRYEVSESELILWSNSQGICMILYEIKAFLMDGWGNPWDYMND